MDSPDDRGEAQLDHFEGDGYYGGEDADMYLFEKASDRAVEEPVQPFKNFGFGCSVEEHVKFGQVRGRTGGLAKFLRNISVERRPNNSTLRLLCQPGLVSLRSRPCTKFTTFGHDKW